MSLLFAQTWHPGKVVAHGASRQKCEAVLAFRDATSKNRVANLSGIHKLGMMVFARKAFHHQCMDPGLPPPAKTGMTNSLGFLRNLEFCRSPRRKASVGSTVLTRLAPQWMPRTFQAVANAELQVSP